MTLQPWREIAVPHDDVRKGTFQQAEFAADLSRVHARTATDEYQDPVLFFQRTFITEGMRLLLDSVVQRLTGRGGDPVIQLQTAFGGWQDAHHVGRLSSRQGGRAGVRPPRHPTDSGACTSHRDAQRTGGRAGWQYARPEHAPAAWSNHRAYPLG